MKSLQLEARVKPKPGEGPSLQMLFRVMSSKAAEFAITAVIVLNLAVLVTADHWGTRESYGFQSYHQLLAAFNLVFYIEAACKLVAFGRAFYLRDDWCRFEAYLVLLALMEQSRVIELFALPPLLQRLLAASYPLRAMRLVQHAKGLSNLVKTIVLSVPSLLNVLSLLSLIVFIYSALGVELYAFVERGPLFTDQRNFEYFGSALLFSFQCLTGDGWSGLMNEALLDDSLSPMLTVTFFVSFQVICSRVVLNLIVAVILENFTTLGQHNSDLVSRKDVEAFCDRWADFDPDATQTIRIQELPALIRVMPQPLGLPGAPRSWIVRVCLNLGLPSVGGRLHFQDVLATLVQFNVQQQMADDLPPPLPLAQSFQEQDDEAEADLEGSFTGSFVKLGNGLAGSKSFKVEKRRAGTSMLWADGSISVEQREAAESYALELLRLSYGTLEWRKIARLPRAERVEALRRIQHARESSQVLTADVNHGTSVLTAAKVPIVTPHVITIVTPHEVSGGREGERGEVDTSFAVQTAAVVNDEVATHSAAAAPEADAEAAATGASEGEAAAPAAEDADLEALWAVYETVGDVGGAETAESAARVQAAFRGKKERSEARELKRQATIAAHNGKTTLSARDTGDAHASILELQAENASEAVAEAADSADAITASATTPVPAEATALAVEPATEEDLRSFEATGAAQPITTEAAAAEAIASGQPMIGLPVNNGVVPSVSSSFRETLVTKTTTTEVVSVTRISRKKAADGGDVTLDASPSERPSLLGEPLQPLESIDKLPSTASSSVSYTDADFLKRLQLAEQRDALADAHAHRQRLRRDCRDCGVCGVCTRRFVPDGWAEGGQGISSTLGLLHMLRQPSSPQQAHIPAVSLSQHQGANDELHRLPLHHSPQHHHSKQHRGSNGGSGSPHRRHRQPSAGGSGSPHRRHRQPSAGGSGSPHRRHRQHKEQHRQQMEGARPDAALPSSPASRHRKRREHH